METGALFEHEPSPANVLLTADGVIKRFIHDFDYDIVNEPAPTAREVWLRKALGLNEN